MNADATITDPNALAYVVLDLESTGLDPQADFVLEVAAVGLTADLDTELFAVDEVVWAGKGVQERLAKAPQEVLDMHETNGLLVDIERPGNQMLFEIEQTLVDLIDCHTAPGVKVFLSGSGVAHFDVHVITCQMPRLAERFHYSMADVGIMRRFYKQQTGGHLCEANTKKTHRAMDDVRCHIEELRAFRDVFLVHAAASGVAEGIPA